MARLMAIIESLINIRFTGKLEITFFEGGVRAVHKAEKIL